MFIDTHTHLFDSAFDEDRDLIIERSISAGVEKMLLPNIDVDTIDAMHQLEEKYPKNCFAMMGLHPGSVKEDWQVDIWDQATDKLICTGRLTVMIVPRS